MLITTTVDNLVPISLFWLKLLSETFITYTKDNTNCFLSVCSIFLSLEKRKDSLFLIDLNNIMNEKIKKEDLLFGGSSSKT